LPVVILQLANRLDSQVVGNKYRLLAVRLPKRMIEIDIYYQRPDYQDDSQAEG